MSTRIEDQRALQSAQQQLFGLEQYLQGTGLDANLLHLVKMRASQINGAPAVVIRDHGKLDRVFAFDVRNGRISAVRVISNLGKLRHLDQALGAVNGGAGRS